MGSFVSKVTDAVGLTNYGDQKKANEASTNALLKSSDKQIKYMREADRLGRERMQPFTDIGLAAIGDYQDMLTPDGQQSYLQDSPMFQAALDSTSRQLKSSAASRGKLGSGGLASSLFNNYLSQGETHIGNQFNRLLNGVGIGQASAAGQTANGLNSANNISGLMGNQGDIIGSGMMARQNINNSAVSGGTGLLINGAMLAGSGGLSGMFGGGAAAGGVGAISSPSAMSSFSDRRLKTDIKEIARDDLGGIYEFKYFGHSNVMVGRMADELQKTRPDAVTEHDSGYLMVSDEFKPRAA